MDRKTNPTSDKIPLEHGGHVEIIYENKKMCADCGGGCCKSMPGFTSPNEWGAPNRKKMKNEIKKALLSGLYCIDCWEGDPRIKKNQCEGTYLIRPVIKGHEGELGHTTWVGGECVFLTDKGCVLKYKDRPLCCRMLEPVFKVDKSQCVCHVGVRQMAVRWLRYTDILKEYVGV